MSRTIRILVQLALTIGLLASAAFAQRPPGPPAPTPTPPPSGPTSTPPGRSPNSSPVDPDALEPRTELVMFLTGRVAIEDGSTVPHDVLVERVCNANVRQQVYASPGGDFTMRLGSITDSFLDASGSGQSTRLGNSPYGSVRKDPAEGIPRRDLMNCEIRVSASGFQSPVVSLVDLNRFDSMLDSVNVGSIVMHRTEKVKGSLNATAYKAPKDARRAYEKGIDALKKGQLAAAQQSFEKAVQLYPKYTSAWFHLGAVLRKQSQQDAARRAYTQATATDKTFLPAYLSLAVMAYQDKNWSEVLKLTDHAVALDPTNRTALTEYVLDLDPADSTGAYFYNAVANYKLNRMEQAEKSARQAEHLDLWTRYPQVHLLLAELFERKHNYVAAKAQTQTYLDLVPNAKNAEQLREQMAEYEALLKSAPSPTQSSDPH